MNRVTTTPFSGYSFRALATSSYFNIAETRRSMPVKSQALAYDLIGQVDPKRISTGLYVLTYSAQCVARLVAGLFITTVVAPIGANCHLLFLMLRTTAAAYYAFKNGTEHCTYRYEKELLTKHLHGLSIDVLTSMSGLLGITYLFNPIALDFTFRPNSATAALLPITERFQFLFSRSLRQQLGISIDPSEVIYRTEAETESSLRSLRTRVQICHDTSELKIAINSLRTFLPKLRIHYFESEFADRTALELEKTYITCDKLISTLENEARYSSKTKIFPTKKQSRRTCTLAIKRNIIAHRVDQDYTNGIPSFIKDLAAYLHGRVGPEQPPVTIKKLRHRLRMIRIKQIKAQREYDLTATVLHKVKRRTLVWYGLAALPFSLIVA